MSRIPVKLVIAGGFGVGKTTFVGSISEIEPLRSEAVMTTASSGIDRLADEDPSVDGPTARHSTKTTTTVAMDFGRIGLGADIVLYLFGTPGQQRFHFMWDELSRGAIGAVVLADTRRFDDCFDAVDFFEARQVPFIVAVNPFHGERTHALDQVRAALQIEEHIPVLFCDARQRNEVKQALISVVEHALRRAYSRRATMSP